MEAFAHLRIIIGMILSLSIALMLRGSAKLVQHPGREKPYWVHLSWALYIFLLLIHFWWYEYKFHNFSEWTFPVYFFLITYIMVYFVLCALLFPDDLKDYTGYEDYFYSRKKWFFAVLAFSYVMDFADTLLKGRQYVSNFDIELPIRNGLHFIFCIAAIKINSKKFHAVLVIAFIVYELSFIWRLYKTV